MKYLLFFFVLSLFYGCQTKRTLKIAVAANTQYAMEDIANEFEKAYGIEVDLIVGSSGKLTAQIEQGAPFDIFIAADTKYPDYLFKKGLVNDSASIYARGQLVLWTLKDYSPSLELLKSDEIKKIAIPNPELAPYGLASKDVLLTQNLYVSIKEKLIYGESVSQSNQFITTQSADIGFTALSVVLSPKMEGIGHWTIINPKYYFPIEQGMVILKSTERNTEAELFYNYIFSSEAQKILQKYGYLTLDHESASR